MIPARVQREKVAVASGDVLEEQIAKLRRAFPEVVVEGRIDFDKLRATLGAAAESGPGRFSFTWAGKDDALALLQTPSRGTLIPCPEESIDFDTTGNVFIEGDNLEVLKLLFKPYFGRIKLIYIDPPYNTGQDFVYPDNYADPLATYLQLTGQADAEGNLLTSNPETSGRYHSAWLSMMYPRLFLARQLLREDGAIFVSIDDHEVHHLRMLMNEVFGEENFIANVVWQKKYSPANDTIDFSTAHDYLMVFRHSEPDRLNGERRPTLNRIERGEKQDAAYKNPDNDPRGPWKPGDYTCNKSAEERPNLYYPITHPQTGKEIYPSKTRVWAFSKEKHEQNIRENRVWWGTDGKANRPAYKRFLSEVSGMVASTWWPWTECGHTDEAKKELKDFFPKLDQLFETPKPSRLLSRVIGLGTSSKGQDIVLDFFAGSCTTAQAVLELNREDGGNRKFLMVQLPEPTQNKDYPTIAEIGKERIRRVIAKLRKEADGKFGYSDGKTPEDLGFKVFKLTKPHIQQWTAEVNRDPDAYAHKLALFNDPLVAGWTAENVLWEIALREGYSLNTRFETKPLANGNTLHLVRDPDTGQHFFVCLDDEVGVDVSKHCELTADRLFVCRDRALDDTAAANLALQCRLKTI